MPTQHALSSDAGTQADRRLTALLCTTQILAMLGTMTGAALLPVLVREWSLSATEGGILTGVFFIGYLIAAPVLVGLTDRIDARRIYCIGAGLGVLACLGFGLLAEGVWTASGFQMLGGMALAGTYMPGLKVLTDRLRGRHRSRRQACYTASFVLGFVASTAFVGVLLEAMGWRLTFALAALGPALSLLLIQKVGEGQPPVSVREISPGTPAGAGSLLSNRAVLAHVLAYGAHQWESSGLRAWIVSFLAFAAPETAFGSDPAEAALLATLVLLGSVPANILGNELAERFGRMRAVTGIMLTGGLLGVGLSFFEILPWWLSLVLLASYCAVASSDGASLTVGVLQAAPPERRGATLATMSFSGFGCAFLAPFAAAAMLHLGGGYDSPLGWVAVFLTLAFGGLLAPVLLRCLVQPAAFSVPMIAVANLEDAR